jgi:outer membrane protein assembly factor BamB
VVPTYRGDAARTGVMAGPGPAGTPTLAWEFAAAGPFSNSPVVARGVVYAASGEGAIHAIDLLTGKERWAATVAGSVSASPLLVGGLLIVGDETGVVHALSADGGSPAWTATTDGEITGSPAAIGDDIVVATMGSHAYRIVAATGAIVWSVDVGGSTRRSVTADDTTAFLGIGGELVAVDLVDGTVRWRTAVATSGDVGTPTVADGLIYAATGIGGEPSDTGVVAVDAATGTVRWTYQSPTQETIYTPAVADGRAFVLGHDKRLVALAARDGDELWSAAFDSELEALPSLVGGTVYVVGNDGPATAVDAATGERLWGVPIQGVPFAPAVADGYLLVGTNVGHLFAIGGSR